MTHRSRHERGQARLRLRLERLNRRLTLLSTLRLLAFAATFVIPGVLLYAGNILAPTWSVLTGLPGLVGFAISLYFYGRVRRERELALGQIDLYAGDATRCENDWWEQLPPAPPPEDLDREHAYADDLNLFGRFSIFQFLDRTTTPGGRRRLSNLLTGQPDASALDPAAWQERGAAVRELCDRRLFRFRFRRRGRSIAAMPGFHKLFDLAWIEHIRNLPDAPAGLVSLWAARILPPLTLAAYIGHEMHWSPAYHYLTLPVQILLFIWMHYRHRKTAQAHGPVADQLAGFDRLFASTAGFRMIAPYLRALSVFEERPAREIRRLASLAGYFDFRRNPLLHGLAGIFLLYEGHVVHALAQWQKRCRHDFAGWFEDLADLDALAALSALRDTDASLCFPENLANDGDADLLIEAKDLAHPLLPGNERVANDFALRRDRKIWLITGSNMSGKSTFLRTVGTALVLALAGAPVCAREFRFRPLRLMTSMNQRDDLARSLSLFYAEVKRIKKVQDASLLTGPPSFLLVDEMLRGTNARERFLASRGILEHLRKSPAAAMIATHDLDLVEQIEGETGNSDTASYHFEEIVTDSGMSFDYTLKDGPVRSSNALKILEMEGIQL